MAWLDAGDIPEDYAYVAIRAALLTVLRHNAGHADSPIRSLLCPDLGGVRKAGVGGDGFGDADQRLVIKQTLLAARGVLSPSKSPKTWAEALLLQRQVVALGNAEEGGEGASEKELSAQLNDGSLEARGLYSEEELDLVVGWARDEKSPKRRLAAAKVCPHSYKGTPSHSLTGFGSLLASD